MGRPWVSVKFRRVCIRWVHEGSVGCLWAVRGGVPELFVSCPWDIRAAPM